MAFPDGSDTVIPRAMLVIYNKTLCYLTMA
jgi:hypothetical protein